MKSILVLLRQHNTAEVGSSYSILRLLRLSRTLGLFSHLLQTSGLANQITANLTTPKCLESQKEIFACTLTKNTVLKIRFMIV